MEDGICLQGEASNNVAETRFTPKSGLAGWFQAIARKQPLYGSGWAEPADAGLRLYGWRRTWLGIGEQAEITIPYGKIRNVVQEGTTVHFDLRGPIRRGFRLDLPSPAAAAALAETLPKAKTRLFERHWRDLQEFNHEAARIAPYTWGTFLLLLLCTCMFVVQAVSAGRVGLFTPEQWIALGALSFQQVEAGEVWRLASSAFLHGDPLHLIFNMWVLYHIGRLTERLIGSFPYLLAYLCCAVISSIGSLLWAPAAVSVGASGAIYGMFGIFLAHLLVRRTALPAALLRAHWLSTSLFVAVTLANGVLQTGVSNAAHLSGLLAGLLLGSLIAWPRLVKSGHPTWRRASIIAAVATLLVGTEWRTGVALWKPAEEWVAFKRSFAWVAAGEAENFQQWAELEQKISVRKVSTQEAANAYRVEIAPFWRDTEQKLYQAAEAWSGDYQIVLRIVASYAHSRVALAEANANYMENPLDTDRDLQGQQALVAVNHASAHMNARIARGDYTYRPRGLSDFPFALRLTRLLSGNSDCVHSANSARFNGDYGAAADAPALKAAEACQAQRDFLSADFAALESRLASYSTTLADLADGSASLDGVPTGLSELFEMRASDLPRHMDLLADWRRQFPASTWPNLLEALLMADTGWALRGHGFAQDIPAETMQMFHFYQTAADEILRESMMSAAGNRYWYELEVGVQNDLAEGRDAMKESYNEGAAMFPLDQALHAQRLRTLMPRWGGSVKEVDGMISKAYAKTANKAGIQVYARLYWIYADLEGESVDIFTASAADWNLMRNGFRDMLQKHPNSDFVANGYARFACQARDAEEYRRIRPQLDGHPSPTAWPPGLSVAMCDKQLADSAAR